MSRDDEQDATLRRGDRRRFLRLIGAGGIIGLLEPGSLVRATARPARLTAASSPLFRDGPGGLQQMLVVHIPDPGFASGAVELGGRSMDVASLLASAAGEGGVAFVPIDPVELEGTMPIRFVRGDIDLRGMAALEPSRRWHFDVVHNSHQDPGYEGLPDEMRAAFPDYLDEARRYVEQTRELTEDARFRWNIEVSYLLSDYRRARGEEALAEVMDLVRRRDMELGAYYCSIQTEALGDEPLRRLMTHATAGLTRKFGIDVRSAILDDVPGFAWGLVDAMSEAGVGHLLWGGNPIRSNLFPGATPPLFAVEGPAGGRVLVWRSRDYTEGTPLIDDDYDVDPVSQPHRLIDALLSRYRQAGYERDRILLHAAGDFGRPARRLSAFVEDWNATWAWPRFRVARLSEFFDAVEADGRPIPTLRGGFTDAWSDLRNTMPAQARHARHLQDGLPAAETVATLAVAAGLDLADRPAEISGAYRSLLLFEEHTVGWEAGRHDIFTDESEGGGRRHYEQKANLVTQAAATAHETRWRALRALGRAVEDPHEDRIVVWNPLSWQRDGLLEIDASFHRYLDDYPGNFTLRDTETGEALRHQRIGDEEERRIVVEVPPVPSVGYRTITASTDAYEAQGGGFSRDNFAIRNDFYEVTVDPRTGAVASIVDRELGRELVDQRAEHGANQLIQVLSRQLSTMDFEPIAEVTTGGLRTRSAAAGPVLASLRYASRVGGTIEAEQEIVLYSQRKRIDFVTRLRKRANYSKEALYLAFPFQLEGRREYGRFHAPIELDVAGGWMRPDVDQLPGSSRDYYIPRHAVLCSDGEAAVAWASHDAPVVQLGGIQSNRLLSSLTSHGGENLIERAHLYSYLMHNYWYTNAPIAQAGEFSFRYSLTSGAASSPRLAAKRFGQELATPLAAAGCAGAEEGLPRRASWLAVDADNVALVAAKAPFEGAGVVVRLSEVVGTPTAAALRAAIPSRRLTSASLCDVNENEIEQLPVQDGRVSVSMRAYQTVTLRLNLD